MWDFAKEIVFLYENMRLSIRLNKQLLEIWLETKWCLNRRLKENSLHQTSNRKYRRKGAKLLSIAFESC